MAETLQGLEQLDIVNNSIYILKNNEGISSIASELGIRETVLNKLEGLGTLRAKDEFQLLRRSDGSGELKKIRTNTSYFLPKEAIYQNIEKGPESFPQIAFSRIALTNEYMLIRANGDELSGSPLIVSATNLDFLKGEIDKVSGVFTTECGARSAISELSCDIGTGNGGKGSIKLNSKSWYDVLSSTVSLDGIRRLLKTNQSPSLIAEALAKTFNPVSNTSDTKVAHK